MPAGLGGADSFYDGPPPVVTAQELIHFTSAYY